MSKREADDKEVTTEKKRKNYTIFYFRLSQDKSENRRQISVSYFFNSFMLCSLSCYVLFMKTILFMFGIHYLKD